MQEIVFISNFKGYPLVLESCFIFWGCQKIKAATVCNRHIKSSYEWIFCKILMFYLFIYFEYVLKELQGSHGPKLFMIEKIGDATKLPRAHTCFNR